MREYEYIELTPIEIKDRMVEIGDIREDIKEYPIIPCLKDDRNLRDFLSLGNMDFIADVEYWQGGPGEVMGFYRRIAPWGIGEIGYQVRSRSIAGLVNTINAIIKDHRGQVIFIYFRCRSPEMPRPLISYVDTALDILDEYERQVRRGYVRRDLLDL